MRWLKEEFTYGEFSQSRIQLESMMRDLQIIIVLGDRYSWK